MKNRIVLLLISIAALISIQASCKSSRVGGSSDCPKQDIEVLTAEIRKEIQKDFSFFYGKIKVNIKDSHQENSFNATVKLKPDSAFAGTVKVAGIMGAAYLIDQDTFAYTNKIKKCYKKESFDGLSKTFGTEVNFKFVQQLILGQAVGIDNVTELYPLKDDNFYVLASHDKKAFQRLKAYNLDDEEVNDIFIQYILKCEDLSLRKIEIQVPKDATVITVDFTKRQKIEGLSFPEETDIKIVNAEDSVFIDLDYSKIILNDSKRIVLNISDSYSECE